MRETPERMAKRVQMIPALLRIDVENILFSDESLFNCTDMQRKMWLMDGEDVWARRTEAWSAQVHCWAVIGVGVQELVFLPDGRVDADEYIDTLKRFILPLCSGRHMLMQDGAPAHTSKRTRQFLSENNVRLLDRPPYSPDLNPVENLWSIVKRQVDVRGCRTSEVLRERIAAAWFAVRQDDIDYLVRSFPRRLERALERNGEDCQI